MGKKDKRVDQYISGSADFAKPILKHLRKLIHSTCPDVVENIKWGFPHFDHKGIMCSMAGFKQHCAFTFWKAKLMKDKHLIKNSESESAMGHFGKITSLKDLPSDKKMISYIKEAMKLNESGVKLPQKQKSTVKKELIIPDNFLKILTKNKKAFDTFQKFSQSHKKEYIDWITEAKTDETQKRRITKSIEWLAEGKSRNWKYSNRKKVNV